MEHTVMVLPKVARIAMACSFNLLHMQIVNSSLQCIWHSKYCYTTYLVKIIPDDLLLWLAMVSKWYVLSVSVSKCFFLLQTSWWKEFTQVYSLGFWRDSKSEGVLQDMDGYKATVLVTLVIYSQNCIDDNTIVLKWWISLLYSSDKFSIKCKNYFVNLYAYCTCLVWLIFTCFNLWRPGRASGL